MPEPKDPPDERAKLLERHWWDYHQLLLRYLAWKLGRRAQDAEDLLQEVFKNLQQSQIDFSQVQDPKGYLLEVARNVAIRDGWKHARLRTVPFPDSTETGDADVCHPEDQHDDPLDALIMTEELELALAEMSEREQAIIQLKYIEGWNTQDIAQEMRRTEDQVERELTKARARLAALLAQRNARKGT
jgi:RNA polymerase sigma factor (sigma-70 family)